MCFDGCKNGCSVVLVRFGMWDTKVILRCFHDQTKAYQGIVMLCVRVFEGNSVFGACELITCAVPDYDYATRNGTEVLLTKRLSLTTVGLAWLPARERVLQFLVWSMGRCMDLGTFTCDVPDF